MLNSAEQEKCKLLVLNTYLQETAFELTVFEGIVSAKKMITLSIYVKKEISKPLRSNNQ